MNKFLELKVENIPEGLRQLPKWVLWKAILKDGKLTKVPFNINGKNASSTNPESWASFEDVIKTYSRNGHKFDGIGFVLTKDDPYTGWDFDKCRNPETNETDPDIKECIETLNSYSEVSPSGTGYRVIVKATLPPDGRKKGNIECYQDGRYLTITGHSLQGTPKTIEKRQQETTVLHSKYFSISEPVKQISNNYLDEQTILKKAFESVNGDRIQRLYNGDSSDYPSKSEADQALCNHLAFWLNRDPGRIDQVFKTSGLYRGKWDKKHYSDGRTYGQVTIEKAVSSCVDTYQDRKPQTTQPKMKQPVSGKSLSFPCQVMTGAAGYFADVYGSVIEAPEHFLFMAYLTCMGAVLSRRLTINSELRTQPRLFTVLVGESATDRKSTTLKFADNHFRNVLESFSSCWGVGSAEGLQKFLNKSKEDDSPGTVLILDELKSFVNKCKIESSILLPSVNTLFESNRFESHTKNKSIEIDNAHLCMLAASTLETYERIYTPAFISIGFTNRVFLVTGTAKRQFSFPEKVPESDIDIMRENLVKVLRHVGSGLELEITPEAKELFHKWYLNMEDSVHARRLDGYAHRLMMLLAVNNLKHEIDVETIINTLALCDWQLEIRKLHDPIDADSEIAKLEERIRRALSQGPLTDGKLKQKTNANRSGLWVYNQALTNLRKADEIAWDKKRKQWFLCEV